jgi:hypothetical protein
MTRVEPVAGSVNSLHMEVGEVSGIRELSHDLTLHIIHGARAPVSLLTLFHSFGDTSLLSRRCLLGWLTKSNFPTR